jgi:hypothetical protein
MNRHYEEVDVRSVENVDSRVSLLRRLPPWRRARQVANRMQQERDRRLAGRVEGIFGGCGLTQDGYSIASGRTFLFPQVVSVVAGPPVALYISMLPGQTPDDFAKHASAIAYHLGVAEVRVVSYGSALIRLELLPDVGCITPAESLGG